MHDELPNAKAAERAVTLDTERPAVVTRMQSMRNKAVRRKDREGVGATIRRYDGMSEEGREGKRSARRTAALAAATPTNMTYF